MRKKGKLYTANKWNQPAFMPKENLFFDGGQSSYSLPPLESYLPQGLSNDTYKKLAIGSAGQMQNAFHNYSQSVVNNLGKGLFVKNKSPFQNTSLLNTDANTFFNSGTNTSGGSKGSDFVSKNAWQSGGAGWGAAGAAAGVMGSIPTGERRGMWDTLDPVHHLAGGRESAAGNAMGDAGVALTQAGLSSGQPWLALAGAGLKVVGGLTNAAFGIKVDEAALKEANEGTNALNNFTSKATSMDDISGPVAQANVKDVYSGGWFSSGDATKKNEELKKRRLEAKLFAQRSVDNNIFNIADDQINNSLANYSAFGGPLDTYDMGALEYGLMTDFLNTKRKKVEDNNKETNLFAGMPSSIFDLGGDIQTHGSDWSSGLVHIDAGHSHEENPYDGVQLGTDNEGIPNLVEEGEVVYNDYVYSQRIKLDDEAKKKFKFPKKKDVTYADAAKKLEKEINERPNDPVSQAGFEAQMQTLEDQQERQKQELESQRAKAAFEALSPQEQQAVIQQVAQQTQAQQVAQAEAMQQPSPEEAAMMQQQQMMQADGSQANLGAEPQQFAEGGSKIRKGVYKALGFHTDKEFLDWARKHKLRGDDKWEMNEGALKNLAEDDEAWKVLISDPTFAEAVKDNPALVHALANNYDFGAFTPDNTGNVTFKDISKGNWTAQDYEGWKDSQDPAWLEAVEKGLVKEGMKQEDIAKALRQTENYKKGSKWLQDSEDNRLRYLRTILEDANSPEVAKNYARKFIDANGWKQGAARDYASIFGADGKGVRETHPGTYWHTPVEAVRGAQAKNFVIGDDGNVEEIVGDVPTDWTAAGNYSWATPENDITYNYYKRPIVAPSEEEKVVTPASSTPASTELADKAPKHRAEWLRYAGLFGPAVGLGLQMAGVGRPDTSSIDGAMEGAGNAYLADYKPLGNYLTYRPMDIWFEQNRMDANARATDRAIMNNATPIGTKMAGLLASGYNNQIADGELYRKALEYNDAKRKDVAEFNRGTDQFNAEAYNRLSQFNADARNRAGQFRSQLAMQAAREKMDADAGWYNSLYGNISGLFKGLSDLGRENAQYNMIADSAADGVYGNLGDSYTGQRWTRDKKKAKGGKMKRKGGLTL